MPNLAQNIAELFKCPKHVKRLVFYANLKEWPPSIFRGVQGIVKGVIGKYTAIALNILAPLVYYNILAPLVNYNISAPLVNYNISAPYVFVRGGFFNFSIEFRKINYT